MEQPRKQLQHHSHAPDQEHELLQSFHRHGVTEMGHYATRDLATLPSGDKRLQYIPIPNINMPHDRTDRFRSIVAARMIHIVKQDPERYAKEDSFEKVIERIEKETGWSRPAIESAVNYAEGYGLRVNRLMMTASITQHS